MDINEIQRSLTRIVTLKKEQLSLEEKASGSAIAFQRQVVLDTVSSTSIEPLQREILPHISAGLCENVLDRLSNEIEILASCKSLYEQFFPNDSIDFAKLNESLKVLPSDEARCFLILAIKLGRELKLTEEHLEVKPPLVLRLESRGLYVERRFNALVKTMNTDLLSL